MNQIQALEFERSNTTSLISYYIKGGVNNTSQLLLKELNAAENIKSEGTKKEVMNALRAIQRNLKELVKIPEKGIAVFSGNGYYV